MYCTVSSSQRLNQKTSLITVDIFVLDRQRHTHTENFSHPQVFSTAANIRQDLHHILKYIPKDSLHFCNMYQTDATVSHVPVCRFGQWKISTAANVESGLKKIRCNSTVQKHSSLEGLHRQNQKEVLGRSQCKALTSVRCDYFTGFTSSSPAEGNKTVILTEKTVTCLLPSKAFTLIL